MENLRYNLFYNTETPKSLDSSLGEYEDRNLIWETESLPLGNGFMGASVFGYVKDELIAITHNAFSNPYDTPKKNPTLSHGGKYVRYGLSNFMDLYIHHDGIDNFENYNKVLNLNDAILNISYIANGINFNREYFTSHKDNVMAVRIKADKKAALNFTINADLPYLGDWTCEEGDGYGRSGKIEVSSDTVTVESCMEYYKVICYADIKILNVGGKVSKVENGLKVEGADEITIIYVIGSNYKMEERVFMEPFAYKKLAPYPHPKDEVSKHLVDVLKFDYETLKKRHAEEFSHYFNRVSVDLGDSEDRDIPTSELVRRAKEGQPSRYLEVLLYMYGRYLLLSSSREDTPPANLQGVWANGRSSPWSAGYWHNINEQMNYWCACNSDIPECFLSYSNYNQIYMKLAKKRADEYIQRNYPEKFRGDYQHGWTLGTGCFLYTVGGPGGHSGPGTGAFTSLLFWDYYDFTRDKEYLRKVAYPVLRDMSLFFSLTLKEIDGKFLVEHSASPEQQNPDKSYYHSVGCAFDQQMVYENYKRTLEAAEILGIEEPLLDTIRKQIDKLDPVLIGQSGQVKEYREEKFYGDIGEYAHRHISHLVGLYPGTVINSKTKEWMDGAKVTLTERGDKSTGWAMMHRLLLWSRTKDGSHCGLLVRNFMKNNIPNNLWDRHPPFQIDGNFGYTAAVCEMLLQSHEGYIELLPALPDEWTDGSFRGLVARGNFVVDCEFKDKKPTRVKILSRMGEDISIKLEGYDSVKISGAELKSDKDGIYSGKTKIGQIIKIEF